MKALRIIVGLAALGVLSVQVVRAQERTPSSRLFRWSGAADWDYYETSGDLQGSESTFTSFRQKYSVDLSGFLWDPRFNQFHLGVDLSRTDRDNDGTALDSDGLGYRAQTSFFLNRSFPLRLYVRRNTIDTTGFALSTQDRETAAWGADWSMGSNADRKLRLGFNRTSFDLVNPLALKERTRTGMVDFSRRTRRHDVALRYNLYDQQELVHGTDFGRDQFLFTERARFRNDSTWHLSTSYTQADSLYSTGLADELETRRLSTRYELPRRGRTRLGISYDFNDNDGRFVNSSSHIGRTTGRFQISPRWDTTGGFTVGRIESESASSTIEQELTGARAGLRYNYDWTRTTLVAGYSLGFHDQDFNIGTDLRTWNHYGELSFQVDLNGSEELSASLSLSKEDFDSLGVGFTRDEARGTVGWRGRVGVAGQGRAALTYREYTYDSFQFGLQESDEVSLQTSVTYSRGGGSLSLSRSDGVSDFIPDPSSPSSPFVPGTDLVREADVGAMGFHWRFLPNLRFHTQARLEKRDFTSTGSEEIVSYHPQVDYDYRTWRFSLGYSHYERKNGVRFSDDTLLLRVSKRFF